MARTKQIARKSAGNLNQENKKKKQQTVLATPTSEPMKPSIQGGNVTTSSSLLGGGFDSKADRKRKRAASPGDSDNPLSLHGFETPRASRIKQEPVSDDESVVEIPEPKKAVTQPKKKVKVESGQDVDELEPLDALEKALETPTIQASALPGKASWFTSNDDSDYDPALSDPPSISAPAVTEQTAEKVPVTSDGAVTSVITFSMATGAKVGRTQPSLADLNNNPKAKKQLKAERNAADETQAQPKKQVQVTEGPEDRLPRQAIVQRVAKANYDASAAAARARMERQREHQATLEAAEKTKQDLKQSKRVRQLREMRRQMKMWPREKVVGHVQSVIRSLAVEKLQESRDFNLVEESLQLALKAIQDEQKVMDGAAPEGQERLEGEIEAREAQIEQQRKARKQAGQQKKKARKEAKEQDKKAQEKKAQEKKAQEKKAQEKKAQEKKAQEKKAQEKKAQEKKTREKAEKQIEKAEKAIKKAQSKESARKAAEKQEKRAERLQDETKAIEKEMEELSKKIKKEKVDGPKKIKKEAKVIVKQEPRE